VFEACGDGGAIRVAADPVPPGFHPLRAQER
jgi:hypothetical protein